MAAFGPELGAASTSASTEPARIRTPNGVQDD
jgi:hypothetical protein